MRSIRLSMILIFLFTQLPLPAQKAINLWPKKRGSGVSVSDFDSIRELLHSELNVRGLRIEKSDNQKCRQLSCQIEAANQKKQKWLIYFSVIRLGSSYILTVDRFDVSNQRVDNQQKLQVAKLEQLVAKIPPMVDQLLQTGTKSTAVDRSSYQGEIMVTSEPAALPIYVDGKPIGKQTPANISLIYDNHYIISIRHSQKGKQSRAITLKRGQSSSLNFHYSDRVKEAILWPENTNPQPEFSDTIFSHFGLGLAPLQVNSQGNPKYLQIGLLYSKVRDIRGVHLGFGLNSHEEGLYPDGSLRESQTQGFEFGLINFNRGSVYGFQLGAINSSRDVSGLQFAIMDNINRGNFSGVQIGLGFPLISMNKNSGDFTGLQFGSFLNINEGHFTGMQSTLLINVNQNDHHGWQFAAIGANLNKGNQTGFQFASLLNFNEGDNRGGQLATINYCAGSVQYFQAGGYNYAGVSANVQFGLVNQSEQDVNFQLGVFNYAGKKAKLQLGVFNYAKENRIPFFPLVNMDF